MQEVRRKKHRPGHFPEDGVTQAENSRKLGEGIFYSWWFFSHSMATWA